MALYLPKFNAVFIHIYKTGGTSVRTAMQKHDADYKEIGIGHSDYREVSELLDLSDKIVFSVVRNPYTWVYSLYEYAKMDINHPFHSFVLKFGFDDFVKWMIGCKEVFEQQLNGKIQSQTEYLSDSNGKINVHVLKMESLQQDFDKFVSEVLKKRKIQLPFLNMGRYKFPEIKEPTKELIRQEYQLDFVNFYQ